MSFSYIVHAANEARENATKQALAAGKSDADAKEAGKRAEAASWDQSASCGLRPLNYALAGMAIGSAIPILGTGLGGIAGYIYGTISAVTNPNGGKDLGDAVSRITQR